MGGLSEISIMALQSVNILAAKARRGLPTVPIPGATSNSITSICTMTSSLSSLPPLRGSASEAAPGQVRMRPATSARCAWRRASELSSTRRRPGRVTPGEKKFRKIIVAIVTLIFQVVK